MKEDETEFRKREREKREEQSAMKDMAAAIILSYQFSEAVNRNISLKIRWKKKNCTAPFKLLIFTSNTEMSCNLTLSAPPSSYQYNLKSVQQFWLFELLMQTLERSQVTFTDQISTTFPKM